MTRSNSWIAPLLALAAAVALAGGNNFASAQTTSGSNQKQSEQPTQSTTNNSSSQSGSQSTSQPAGQLQSTSQSGQTASGQNTPASNTRSTSGQTSTGGQATTSGQAGGQASSSHQQGQTPPTPPTQPGTQGNQQPGAARDMQSRDAQFRDSQQSRDTQRQFGDNRQTNVNVGIQFGAVTDRGLTVTSIERNSVFATSGLVQGDVIISVGGRPVRSQVEFVQFISVRRGEPIPVVVFRNGREETIHITYDASLIAPQGPANVGAAGANLLGVTFDTQVQNAAVVLHVVPGGPAATVGIKPGDEIVAINGQRINGHQQANQIVGAMRPGDQVEIQYLQLQQAQIVLGGPNVPRTAAAAGEVRVDQNVQRSNYQPEIQVQTNQGQNARLEGNVNRDTRQQPQSSGNQDQRPRNRSLLPRIRN
jgi:hypothetical protein